MERQGYVSLWIGSAKSDDELWEYAQMIYTEDGDYLLLALCLTDLV